MRHARYASRSDTFNRQIVFGPPRSFNQRRNNRAGVEVLRVDNAVKVARGFQVALDKRAIDDKARPVVG